MEAAEIKTGSPRIVFGGLNFVLVANDLNPGAFRSVWQPPASLLRPEELVENSIITPAAVVIPAPNFQFLVVNNRIQLLFPTDDREKVTEPLNRILGGILKSFSSFPFSALGINFEIFLGPKHGGDFGEWNARSFASPIARSVCGGGGARPRYGSYFSCNCEEFRMKTDAKPVANVVAQHPVTHAALKEFPEWMRLEFNYHLDLKPESAATSALEGVLKWERLAAFTKVILSKVQG